MKREIKFALFMTALLGVSFEEAAAAQAAFVYDYNKAQQEGKA